ncbi:unknown protein [Desulfotalea psychrophila LSv54]|uniref:Uncharacterized protein n=1 Tax=Desulfotalea psychrophila (strain LSv54 / DSM 12343) TaxID=177439 RepID=Q6AKL6_DESPS|nr:unknown protein [Desulfotalea psychrophila LSv54]
MINEIHKYLPVGATCRLRCFPLVWPLFRLPPEKFDELGCFHLNIFGWKLVQKLLVEAMISFFSPLSEIRRVSSTLG